MVISKFKTLLWFIIILFGKYINSYKHKIIHTYICIKINMFKIFLFPKSLFENYEISFGSFRTHIKSIFSKACPLTISENLF